MAFFFARVPFAYDSFAFGDSVCHISKKGFFFHSYLYGLQNTPVKSFSVIP